MSSLKRLCRDDPRADPFSMCYTLMLPVHRKQGGAVTGGVSYSELIYFGEVWKGVMEERLCCFRAELHELKAYSHAPPLLVTVLEAVLLMLGTHFYLLY